MTAIRSILPSFYAREFQRFALPTPVVVASRTDITEGTIVNLSLAGCAIESVPPCPVGTFLPLTLLLPNEAPFLSIDSAVVRWDRGQKLGLGFVRIPEGTKHSLAALLWDELIYNITKNKPAQNNCILKHPATRSRSRLC